LITGNQGFIGAWVSLRFHEVGFRLYGLDNRSSYGRRMFDEAGLDRLFQKQFMEDVADFKGVQSVVQEIKPDIIVHLAGQAIVPRAFAQPFYTFMTNAVGTLVLLEATRNLGSVKSIVCITSDKVYENMKQVWPYRENDRLGGHDIYSTSKATAELVSSAYARAHLAGFDTNVQTVRLGNVVGGGDWSIDRLIPDLMYAVAEKKPFFVRYANATRPFQHVLDAVEAIYRISAASLERKFASGESWNLGPKNNSYARVADVIEMCKAVWPETVVQVREHKVKEDMHLAVDVSKLAFHFGAPKYESYWAVENTFKWYEQYLNGKMSVGTLIESEFSGYRANRD
jgi:CDP-glucose 4,6-dehydratase